LTPLSALMGNAYTRITGGISVSETNDRRQAVELPLANSEEFCQAVLDDIERVFRDQYGRKWTPEAQQLFQGLRDACIRTARIIDGEASHRSIEPLREAVILSNFVGDGRRGGS